MLSQTTPIAESIHGAGLAGVACQREGEAACWYAAYTCARHEKLVRKQLEERRISCFLPLYRSLRRWKDRRKELELALFPGYVFVRNGIANGVSAEPHPYLRVGQRVRVKYGPLAGAEGILVRKKDKCRLVLNLDLIMRSVAAEVDAADLE